MPTIFETRKELAIIYHGLALLAEYSERTKAMFPNQTDDFFEWIGKEAEALQKSIREQTKADDRNLLTLFKEQAATNTPGLITQITNGTITP